MRIVPLSQLEQFAAVQLLRDGGAIGGPVVVPQCAQITVQFSLEGGKTGHLVWYGRYSGGFAGTVAQANAILSGLGSAGSWVTLAAFFSTGSTSLSGVTIRDVNTPNQVIIQSTGSGFTGASASPSMPNEVAAVVTLRTALAGRQNRGRSYVPGWATNALGAGNVIAAGAVTALQGWANVWAGVLSAQGYTFVIGQKHRQAYTGTTGTQHPDRPAGSVPITAVVVRDNHWDTQRRRGFK